MSRGVPLATLVLVPVLVALAGPAGAGARQKPAAAAKPTTPAAVPRPPVSKDTQTCLECHDYATPGIVADWRRSRHSSVTPADALKKPALERRVSAETVPAGLADAVVGCYECHRAAAGAPDAFDHNGTVIHTVVSPATCGACHPVEREQYSQNLMSHAVTNLSGNPLFKAFCDEVNGPLTFGDGVVKHAAPDALTESDSCNSCHGTDVKVVGKRTVKSDLGDQVVPVLSGWPNNGVGRLNPDGTAGACTSCHARHAFSIEVARRPHTCEQCHRGPDVPAYKVWEVSKHGNLFLSQQAAWNFDHVPWIPGVDFGAPGCAACHASLIADKDGGELLPRTHRFSDRLATRIFGLIYSHPTPAGPDTTVLRNRAGLPLPTELTGEPAPTGLITPEEQQVRTDRMKKACSPCHSTQWVDGHFERFEHAVRTTDAQVAAATAILATAWDRGLARGIPQKESPFDEPIERQWVQQWLFYGNTTRFAAAMAGADYGVFQDGRWSLTRTVREMAEWLKDHSRK